MLGAREKGGGGVRVWSGVEIEREREEKRGDLGRHRHEARGGKERFLKCDEERDLFPFCGPHRHPSWPDPHDAPHSIFPVPLL